jgi:ABC-type glycerol-3-phosphate transport system substrate-binding protein
MRKNVSSILPIWLVLSILLILGACRRAPTPEPPAITIAPILTQGTGESTPVVTASQTAGPGTETGGVPTGEEPYPLSTYPIIPETGMPYPQPSSEVVVPIVETTPTSAYPAPLATNTQSAPQLPAASQTPTINSPTPTTSPTEPPPASPTTSSTEPPPASPTASPTETSESIPPYPGSSPYPTVGETLPYPGPQFTSTPPTYQTSATSTQRITQTPSKPITASPTTTGTIYPTVIPSQGTGTPQLTPTDIPPRPPLSPPPAGSSVVIWHSWSSTETAALQSIIQSFQRLFPTVTFSLQYIPQDDLYNSYADLTSKGQGPSLLLGPSNWGPELFNEKLITNLDTYVPANYLATINPVALSSGKYKGSLISLPLSEHGLLMFRNISLITTAPTSMDNLKALSLEATHGGIVGSYLDRGSYFSSPAIIGLGGRLMDQNGYPEFNDEYGLEWLDLLRAYDEAGAVTFNTNWDLERFKQARVGIIIDGSWNISMLAQSIGNDNLAIDPWPTYGTGHLSGWVETDSIFLNPNITNDNRFAALSFMGYLLDPTVQMYLAEVGHIPSVTIAQPRDVFIKQAMVAFLNGAPYPITVDDAVLSIYRNELDNAIRGVFDHGMDPESALQTAEDNIIRALNTLETVP